MEDQVEEVKRKTDIVGLIGQYVSLKKMGRHHKGLCPFHAEKTASFTVNEELGLYKCFGCGAGGDAYKFLMEIEGIDFRDALERLADKVGVKLVSRKFDGGDEKRKMLEVMDLAARYYHWLLTVGRSGEEARNYLQERKINEKLIETFNVGYALPGWNNLTNYLIGKKGYKEDLLEKCGLVSRGKGVYDKFRGRIMFPLQDAGGKVVGFSGRLLPNGNNENEAKYLNSPETELYHKGRMLYGFFQAKQDIRKKKRVVLVEGQMDLISSFGAGVGETVAIGGTALTEDQIEMLARMANSIYLSFDADEAGIAAIKRAVGMAEKRGLDVKVVQIEGGKDPDEIASKNPLRWREMVDNAVDVYEFVIDSSMKRNDKEKVQGIKIITEEVAPFLSKIENSVVRDVWTRKFAEKLGVEALVVKDEIDRVRSGKTSQTEQINKKPVDAPTEGRSEKLMRRVIGGLLTRSSLRTKVRGWFEKVELEGAMGKALKYVCQHPEDSPLEILKGAQAELVEVIQEAYMAEGENENSTDKEVVEMAVQLLREQIRKEKKRIMEEMETARKEGRENEEEQLFAKLNELNREESRVVVLLG